MDFKELRPGNIITSNNDRYIFTVLTIIQRGMDVSFADYGPFSPPVPKDGISGYSFVTFNDVKGIPLTDKVLEACGFALNEDLGDMQYYQIPGQTYGFGIECDHEDWVFYHFTNQGTYPLLYDVPHFQYLHQLQNLYFALTGKELMIDVQNLKGSVATDGQ